MTDDLQTSIQTALRLEESSLRWLKLHDCSPSVQEAQRPCRDEPLSVDSLPIIPCITERATLLCASEQIARGLNAIYLGEVRRLGLWVVTEYRDFLADIANSHAFCDAAMPSSSRSKPVCPVSLKMHLLYRESYLVQATRLADVALGCVSTTRPTHVRDLRHSLTDVTPILEFAFLQSSRPSKQDKVILSRVTGRTEKQIGIWFQNRRARDKAMSRRHEAPASIEDLEGILKDQQRVARSKPRVLEKCSGNESTNMMHGSKDHRLDSGMEELIGLFSKLRIDEAPASLSASPTRKPRPKDISSRASSSSEDQPGQKPMRKRPVAGRVQRETGQQALQESQPQRAIASPAPAFTSVGSPPAPAPEALSYPPDAAVEAASANSARRRQKPVPLSTRRPRARAFTPCDVSSSPPSSSPSSSRTSSSSSRSSSGSSHSTILELRVQHEQPQLYYRDAATGDFVPVSGSRVVISSHAGPPVDVPCSKNDIAFGTPAQPVFAPDDNPRAFSSNLLECGPSISDSPPKAPALLDLSCLIPDVRPVDAVHDTPPLLDALHAFAATSAHDSWLRDPSPLDVVNYSYSQSWSTAADQTHTYAHLLGVDA